MKQKKGRIIVGVIAVILGLYYYNVQSKESRQEMSQMLNEVSVLYDTETFDNIISDAVDATVSELIGNESDITKTLVPAEFISVVDGDTINVCLNGKEEKVRLIGVDTPESVHTDSSKNNEFGNMASDYTKSLLKGTEYVYLQYDTSKTDTYDRILAYVWLSNDVDVESGYDIDEYMLNAILVENGYAYDKVYEPNTYYALYFEYLRENAEENNIGLWVYDGFHSLWK